MWYTNLAKPFFTLKILCDFSNITNIHKNFFPYEQHSKQALWFKCYLLLSSWYMHKCNFSYTHKKSMAFPASYLSKVTHAQQQYLQILYTELQMLQTINMAGRNRNSFKPQCIAFTMMIFKELIITQCIYGKPLYQTVIAVVVVFRVYFFGSFLNIPILHNFF